MDASAQVLLYAQAGSTAEALCKKAAICFDLDMRGDITVSMLYGHQYKHVQVQPLHCTWNMQLFQQDTRCAQVIPLRKCHLILPTTYPSWTLIGQAQGSVRLALEGLQQAVPEASLFTMWCARCTCAPDPHRFCCLAVS